MFWFYRESILGCSPHPIEGSSSETPNKAEKEQPIPLQEYPTDLCSFIYFFVEDINKFWGSWLKIPVPHKNGAPVP